MDRLKRLLTLPHPTALMVTARQAVYNHPTLFRLVTARQPSQGRIPLILCLMTTDSRLMTTDSRCYQAPVRSIEGSALCRDLTYNICWPLVLCLSCKILES